MDRTVPATDVGAYRKWLASPSISTAGSSEMVLTWNLAARFGLHPTRALRSLRRHRGYLAGEMDAIMAAVAADPDLVFRRVGDFRRVDFAGAGRARRTKRRSARDR